MNKKKAFTLAEVLVTLAVIGIVASMTIPTLLKSNQEVELRTRAKKVVSNFERIFLRIMAETDCAGDFSCTNVFNTNGDDDEGVVDNLAKYFPGLIKCGMFDSENCFTTVQYKNFSTPTKSLTDYAFQLQDSSLYFIDDLGNNMGINCSSGLCAHISIDINGNKGPNELYVDWFPDVSLKKNGKLELESGSGLKLSEKYLK